MTAGSSLLCADSLPSCGGREFYSFAVLGFLIAVVFVVDCRL